MLATLIQSAFQTGYVSVESEGLIRQVLSTGFCTSADLQALENLYAALDTGNVRRESHQALPMPAIGTVMARRWFPH
jgi:hypothetical protein